MRGLEIKSFWRASGAVTDFFSFRGAAAVILCLRKPAKGAGSRARAGPGAEALRLVKGLDEKKNPPNSIGARANLRSCIIYLNRLLVAFLRFLECKKRLGRVLLGRRTKLREPHWRKALVRREASFKSFPISSGLQKMNLKLFSF